MPSPAEIWPEAGPSISKRGISRSAPSSLRRETGFTSWNKSRRYAVIVDAGSSGSRMQIYSWKDTRADKAQRERVGESVKVLPTVEKGTWEGSGRDWQLKVEPGLSSFGPHPEDLDNYLEPLFDHATTIIPPEALADTPVYVLATAGMRLLPAEQRNAVLRKTCDYIDHRTPFHIGAGGCEDHVQVITGEEEGLLGWIAINYLMDGFHFKPTTPVAGAIEGTKGKSTYGFLDMGGASTQIAFEPSGHAQDKSDAKDLTPVSLRMLDGTDVTHNVFVTTFLGFGTNKARERYIDALSSTSKANPMPDPCLPDGLRMVDDKDHRAGLIGTGSFDKCLASLHPLLEKDAKCNRPPCLFNGVHVPTIDFSVNHFIGVSEYWFSSNDVFKLGGVYDFVSFQKAAQTFCNRPWSELAAELKSGQVYGPQVSKDRLELQCFKAAWMTTVLHEGIGLPRIVDSGGKGDGKHHADSAQDKADEKNLFQSVNDVDGLAVSWTLGKAVLEASKEIAPLTSNPVVNTPDLGLPTELSDALGDSTKPTWIDSHKPTWSGATSAFKDSNKVRVGGSALLAVILLTMCLTGIFCMLRGRSAKAVKRRNMLKDMWRGSCLKKRPRGDYVLADMEEGGHDMDTLTGAEGDVALSSDSGDEADHPKGLRHKHRRSSGNGLIAALLVPVQRLALAMGISNAASSSTTSNTSSKAASSGRLAAKRNMPMHLPFRRVNTNPNFAAGPSSPAHFNTPPMMASNSVVSMGTAISRPASRASNNVLSPRLTVSTPNANGTSSATIAGTAGSMWIGSASTVEASGGFFAHQLPASSTTSARSSRAASPALGGSANGRSNRHHGAPPGFARRGWEE